MKVTDVEFTVTMAFLLVTLVALIWASLWRHRSVSVNLWCMALLLGAAFLGVIWWRSTGAEGLLPVQHALLASLGLGSLTLKSLALHRLEESSPATSKIKLLLWLTGGFALLIVVAPLQPSTFTALLVAGMNAGALVSAYAAHRLARQQRLLNARLLSVLLGAAGLLSSASWCLTVGSGIDMLQLRDLPMSVGEVAFSLMILVCNNGLFIGVVMDISARRETAAMAEVTRLQAERQRLQERAQLMADLHDGFGSQLNIASMEAERGLLTPTQMHEVLQECMMDLYLVVDTANRTEGDIGNALRYLRHRVGGRLSAGQPVLHWDLDVDDAPALPPSTVLQVVRIVQEALNNALRHAQADNIHVFASHDGDTRQLHISVLDDGIGLPTQRVEGNGLRNLRSRAAKLGAALQIRNAAPGTLVELSLPTP